MAANIIVFVLIGVLYLECIGLLISLVLLERSMLKLRVSLIPQSGTTKPIETSLDKLIEWKTISKKIPCYIERSCMTYNWRGKEVWLEQTDRYLSKLDESPIVCSHCHKPFEAETTNWQLRGRDGWIEGYLHANCLAEALGGWKVSV